MRQELYIKSELIVNHIELTDLDLSDLPPNRRKKSSAQICWNSKQMPSIGQLCICNNQCIRNK